MNPRHDTPIGPGCNSVISLPPPSSKREEKNIFLEQCHCRAACFKNVVVVGQSQDETRKTNKTTTNKSK